MPKDRGAKPSTYDKCQELINVHRQQTEARFQPTHAEMSWSTLKGKDHFGQNLNRVPKPGVAEESKYVLLAGTPKQELYF